MCLKFYLCCIYKGPSLRKGHCTVTTQWRKQEKRKRKVWKWEGELVEKERKKILSFLLSRSQGNKLSYNNDEVNRHPWRKHTSLKPSFIFNTWAFTKLEVKASILQWFYLLSVIFSCSLRRTAASPHMPSGICPMGRSKCNDTTTSGEEHVYHLNRNWLIHRHRTRVWNSTGVCTQLQCTGRKPGSVFEGPRYPQRKWINK